MPCHAQFNRFEAKGLRLGLGLERNLEAPARHAELLHRQRDGVGQLGRRAGARRADSHGFDTPGAFGLQQCAFEGCGVGGGGQCAQLVLP